MKKTTNLFEKLFKIFLIISSSLIIIFLFSCTNKKVENLGIFGKSRIFHVVGQDGCTPIPINKNITLWTFGDTILGKWKKNVHMGSTFEDTAVMQNMLSNSLAYSITPTDENIDHLKFNFYKEENNVSTFLKKKQMKKITISGSGQLMGSQCKSQFLFTT